MMVLCPTVCAPGIQQRIPVPLRLDTEETGRETAVTACIYLDFVCHRRRRRVRETSEACTDMVTNKIVSACAHLFACAAYPRKFDLPGKCKKTHAKNKSVTLSYTEHTRPPHPKIRPCVTGGKSRGG